MVPNKMSYLKKKKGDPAEGIDSEDLVALSHVCIPSMHVSGMVAASYFARAAAWLTPLTLSFRTLSATPLESPDPERARTYLIVREARLQCSPFCTCLPLTRTLSVTHRTFMLHAYPSNAPSHSPQRTRQSPCTTAHGLRAMHTSHLLLSTTLKRPCPLPPPLRPPRLRAPCSAHGSGHVSQQNRTCYRRVAM